MSNLRHELGGRAGRPAGAMRACALFLTGLFILFSPVRADVCQTPGFIAPTVYSVASSSNAIASADVTRDGIIDLIVPGNTSDSAISVLPGNADGTFGSPIVTSFAFTGSPVIATGVFDESGGNTDVVLDTFPMGLIVLPGNGDGTFQAPVPLGGGASVLKTADVNLDGHLDIVAADGSFISVFLGDGQGHFTGPFQTPLWSGESLAIGDVDGDGIPDAVSTRSLNGNAGDTIVYYPGRGDGTFDPSINIFTVQNGGFLHLQLADLTGDGKLDILAVEGFTLQAFAGHDDGTFDPPITTFAPPGPTRLSLADFDGDGIPDLAIAQSDPDSPSPPTAVDVFLGNGNGSFHYAATYAAGPESLTTAAFGSSGYPSVATIGGDAVWVLAGNGDGSLRAELLYDAGLGVEALATGDFNEDGKPDVASLVYLVSGGQAIFYAFGGPGGHMSGGGTISPNVPLSSLAAGDINGDGHIDLATLRTDTPSLLVYTGNGHGSFVPSTSTPVPSASFGSQLYVADVDGDGALDAISLDPNAAQNQIGVLLNNGDGTFRAATPLSFAVPVSAAVIADFNGDHKADLAVVGGTPGGAGQLLVLLGNGDGSFEAPVSYPTNMPPLSVAAGLLDSGNSVDLVVGQNPILVFPGNGDGTFAAPIPVAADFSPSAMVVADFRGGGVTDLLVAGGGETEYLPGNGDGTFGLPIGYPFGIYQTSLVTGDFDGNATLDAAAASANLIGGGFILLLNASRAVVVPEALTAAPGLSFEVTAAAAGSGQLTYQWRKGGVPLSDGGAISGSTTGTLTINPVSFSDAGSYDVVVTDACGSTTSNPATLSVEFADVPTSSPFHADIITIATEGITSGCGGGNYCPTSPVRRDQMAAFLLKAEHGSSYNPPPCTGVFADVPCPSTFANWIEQLASEGVTSGCGNGNYCPSSSVTRAQMAVFLLKTKNGASYVPPPAVGIFGDVPIGSFAANFIEALYNAGITGGCQASPLLYCPDNPVLRQQMATFLVRTFGL